MIRPLSWWKSSIAAKQVVAATGGLLFLWLIAHMAGNLLVFAGREAMNSYAAWLKASGFLLWTMRFLTLLLAVAHVAMSLRLARQNRAARPVPYRRKDYVQASFASRSMVPSGLVVLAFVVFHLLHFTIGVVQRGNYLLTDAQGRHDVYSMVVLGFQSSLVTASYVAAVALLALHLSHGLSSLGQTLGLHHPIYTPWVQRLGPVVAAALTAGFLSVPIAVQLRIVTPLSP
jgi:succinate dehydrogenase / fumarate reductase cytochrome b subunit